MERFRVPHKLRMSPFFMIISLSGKEKWLPFDEQRGAVQTIKNREGSAMKRGASHSNSPGSLVDITSWRSLNKAMFLRA
jgi:hypothetical protein